MRHLTPRIALLFVLAGAGGGWAAEPAPRLRLLVPAYFYPGGKGLKQWDRVLATPDRADLVVIVDPANGPGGRADPNYVRVIDRARKAGVPLLGYVTTSYAKRPAADVKRDVDTWLRFYPGLHGIFFDEQASGAEHVAYQAGLYDYVRQDRRLALVVTNPGTVCAEEYLSRPALDATCLFEGPKEEDSFRLPEWTARYASRVALLAYRVKTADGMRRCVREAAARKAGYVYVSDADGADPWERLPAYWDEEVAAVREVNQRKAE